jgi:hypothetical protein
MLKKYLKTTEVNKKRKKKVTREVETRRNDKKGNNTKS